MNNSPPDPETSPTESSPDPLTSSPINDKKKPRLPASCSVCRKRKTKCDRLKPVCGLCKRRSISHLCFYESDTSDRHHNSNVIELPPLEAPNAPHYHHQQQQLQSKIHNLPQHNNPQQQQQQQQQHAALSHPQLMQPPGPPGPPHVPGPGPGPGPVGPGPGPVALRQVHPLSNIPQQIVNTQPAPSGPSIIFPGQYGTQNPPGTLPPLQKPNEEALVQTSHHLPPQACSPMTTSTSRVSSIPESVAIKQNYQHEHQHERELQHPHQHHQHHQHQHHQHEHHHQHQQQLEQQQQIPPSMMAQQQMPPIPQLQPPQHLPQQQMSPPIQQQLPMQAQQTPNRQTNHVPPHEFRQPRTVGSSISSLSSVAGGPESADHLRLLARSNMSPQTISNSELDSSQDKSITSESVAGEPSTIENGLVAIEIGPNSILHILENDRMDVFSNASFSFSTEGRNWQNQGTLTYVGLTKSDSFLKTLRYFALALFQSGLIRQFVKKRPLAPSGVDQPPMKKLRRKSVPINLNETDSESHEEIQTPEKLGKEDEMEEDGIVVTKIDGLNEDDGVDDENTTPAFPKSEQEGLHEDLQMFIHAQMGNERSYEAIANIALKVIPSKRTCHFLLRRFFCYVHPFIAILDEDKTWEYLASITGERHCEPAEKITKLVIRSDRDLHILGIILLTTRLGYMSMMHNSMSEVNFTEIDRAVMTEVGRVSVEDFSSVVHFCIGDFLQSKSSLEYILFLTLAYFFRKVNPVDGEGLAGADSNILFSTICSSAIGSGIHRDPTTYSQHPTIYKNAALINQWRRLWSYIVMQDTASAMYRGTPMNIPSLDISDVQSPTLQQAGWDDCYANLWEISEGYRRICYRITNIRLKPKVAEILNYAKKLEGLFLDYFGTDFFKEYICKPAPGSEALTSVGIMRSTPSSINATNEEEDQSPSTNMTLASSYSEGTIVPPFSNKAYETYPRNSWEPLVPSDNILNERAVKVVKFCKFIELRTNLSSMYFMVATHYENAYNSEKTPSMKAGIELFKIYIKSVVQLVYIMSYILDNTVELFGENYDFLITSHLEKCMIKTHSFLSSFFARLLHHKKELSKQNNKHDPSIASRLETINSLFNMVILDAELFVGNFRKLGRRYKNSHRLYVMARFFFQQCTINPDAIFESKDPRFYHDGTNMLEFFTTNELQYLCSLCEEFKARKNEQLNAAKHNARSQSSLSRDSISPSSNISEPQNTFNTLMSVMGESQSEVSSFSNFEPGKIPFDPASFSAGDLGDLQDLQTFQLTSEQLDAIFPGGRGVGATNAEFLKLFEIFGAGM